MITLTTCVYKRREQLQLTDQAAPFRVLFLSPSSSSHFLPPPASKRVLCVCEGVTTHASVDEAPETMQLLRPTIYAHHESINLILDIIGQLPDLTCPKLDLVVRWLINRRLRDLEQSSLHALKLCFEEHDLTPHALLQFVLIREQFPKLGYEGTYHTRDDPHPHFLEHSLVACPGSKLPSISTQDKASKAENGCRVALITTNTRWIRPHMQVIALASP